MSKTADVRYYCTLYSRACNNNIVFRMYYFYERTIIIRTFPDRSRTDYYIIMYRVMEIIYTRSRIIVIICTPLFRGASGTRNTVVVSYTHMCVCCNPLDNGVAVKSVYDRGV